MLSITAASIADPTVTSSISLQLLNPMPVLSSGSISSASATTYTLSFQGTGFVAASQLLVNSIAATITSLSATQITATVASTLLSGASAAVQVSNPSPGAALSQVISVGIPPQPTGLIAAARFLDQSTFGPSFSDIAHVQTIGLTSYLSEQLGMPASLEPAESWWYGALPSACKPLYQCQTDGYWAQFAIFGPDQLRQRIAFTLSKIFNVSYDSVPVPMFPYFLNVLANDAFGNWRTLMEDVTTSEAMGTYLNMINSAAPSDGMQANENYAREFMQLFNLGPDRLAEDGSLQLSAGGVPSPTYTSAQVQGLARAFTGWTYANDDCTAPAAFHTIVNGAITGLMCPMRAVPGEHDSGAKELLDGVSLPANQTPEQDLDEGLDAVFQDANLPPFVVTLLIQNLVSSSPSPAYIKRTVDVFKNDGAGVRGNLAAVISAILLDPEARQGDFLDTEPAGGHLRDPILWTFAALRALSPSQAGDESGVNVAVGLAGAAGELAHSQPSVFGFYSPSFVIPGTSLAGPEFQLETPSNLTGASGVLENNILHNYFWPSQSGSDISVDLSLTSPLGLLAVQGVQPFIAGVNSLFYHGRMSSEVQQLLTANLAGLNPQDMLQVGLYAVLMSPQFRVSQ
jgi:uncharacterized protein (DUF1800 family)